jgi:hypothetical protein
MVSKINFFIKLITLSDIKAFNAFYTLSSEKILPSFQSYTYILYPPETHQDVSLIKIAIWKSLKFERIVLAPNMYF